MELKERHAKKTLAFFPPAPCLVAIVTLMRVHHLFLCASGTVGAQQCIATQASPDNSCRTHGYNQHSELSFTGNLNNADEIQSEKPFQFVPASPGNRFVSAQGAKPRHLVVKRGCVRNAAQKTKMRRLARGDLCVTVRRRQQHQQNPKGESQFSRQAPDRPKDELLSARRDARQRQDQTTKATAGMRRHLKSSTHPPTPPAERGPSSED